MSNKRYDDYTKDNLMRLLESLTPGGSEYYEEPETCAERIRDYQRSIKHHMVKRKEAERQRDQLLAMSNEVRHYLRQSPYQESIESMERRCDLLEKVEAAIAAAKGHDGKQESQLD